MVRGIPTAHSAYSINEQIASGNDIYVWPYAKGNQWGQAIEPLYILKITARNIRLL